MPTTATRTGAVIDWLQRNPGWHTPSNIARGIGKPTQATASTLLYLHRHGKVERMRGRVNNGPGSSVYSALSDPPTNVASNGSGTT